MVRIRPICVAVVLAGAIISRQVGAQSSSVSLTHTVTVTVPPRVKVEVGNAAAPSALKLSGKHSESGLSLSINATQAWSLSIGALRNSKLQWSRDGDGFSTINEGQSTVASGTLSLVTTSATVFVRPARAESSVDGNDDDGESKEILLTIVAP